MKDSQEQSSSYTLYLHYSRSSVLHVGADQLTSNHHSLDLTGSLIDLVDLGVSHQLLHRVFAVEAVSSEDLDGVGGCLVGLVGSEALGNRGKVGGAHLKPDVSRGLVGHESAHLEIDGHVGQHELNCLVVSNLRSECLALQRSLGALIECSPHDSECACSHSGAGHVEGAHGNLESGSMCSEHILLGHTHILEGDGASVRATLAHHLLLLSPRDSGCVSIDDECSECLASGGFLVGVRVASEDEEPLGVTATRDPALGSVENVFVSLLLTRSLHSVHIRSRSRLRHAVGGDQRLGGQHTEVLLLLLLSGRNVHGGDGERGTHDGDLESGAAIRKSLHDKRSLHVGHTRSTVLLGDLGVHDAERVRLLHNVPRELARLVVLGCGRSQLLLGELERRCLNLALSVRQIKGQISGLDGPRHRSGETVQRTAQHT
ncbi:hypothetical protein PFISCL1PPCAC_23470, partial [Pristionchus fissidentatus]